MCFKDMIWEAIDHFYQKIKLLFHTVLSFPFYFFLVQRCMYIFKEKDAYIMETILNRSPSIAIMKFSPQTQLI